TVTLVVLMWAMLGLVLVTVAFLTSADDRPVEWRAIAVKIVRNPLLIAMAIGLTLKAANAGEILKATPLLDTIGGAAIALGLLAMGAGLDLHAFRSSGWILALSLVASLLVMPLLMAGVGSLFGLSGVALGALVMLAAMPTPPTGFVMARQMGANAPLMAAC
ncbi:MAG: AEC family transporter, partial [Anderseniella sp.]|nr:AEC family transporter [Anderseniella sp.]